MPSARRLTLFSAAVTLTSAASQASAQFITSAEIALDFEALQEYSNDPAAYGEALSAQFFADQPLRAAWRKARAVTTEGDLQLRLCLDIAADQLYPLHWETLRDPQTGQPIALHERVRLVRALSSREPTPVIIPPRPDLHALLVVSNPSNLGDFNLAAIDVAGAVERTRAALGDMPITILGDHADAVGRATLANLISQLRNAPPIVILLAHGYQSTDQFWLEQAYGTAHLVSSYDLVVAIERLAARPLLLMLAFCRSTTGTNADMLSSLGPRLADAGVPAVLSVQGDTAIDTLKTLLPTLISELRRDGQIDRALATTRTALGAQSPWWQAALWLRTDGRLWDARPGHPNGRQERLHALLHDHSGLIASRMEAFVGREPEVAEIRQRIAEQLPTGGYVTITGQTGQGTSSVIAKLVADALGDDVDLRARLLEPGVGVPICHFIPSSPGPDHQVDLLRNLIARLCLTYDLPEVYAVLDSRPALCDSFAAALRDLHEQGCQEVIFIDGLDQIAEDAHGVRDLSFLPEEPPVGIVFVLGTGPNDTLEPLALRKHQYGLPALSRSDVDVILAHRKVQLDITLADRFYAAMQGNALYLDLVARELAQADAIDPEQIIARVADNPANLFSLSIERLQRNKRQWEKVLRPILGLLLATRAPLSQRALCTLIDMNADEQHVHQGLQRLGGFVQHDGEGRYELFHPALDDFLRQAVFAADEAVGYHQQLASWCEGSTGSIAVIWVDAPGDAPEQERRTYARQHYIAHVAAARSYERLWAVIDIGAYGTAKRRHDLSNRSYALDLDSARQAVIDAAAGDIDAQAQALPRLWRYSLLRCSLISPAEIDQEGLFLALVVLGRIDEAIRRAELLPNPKQKTDALRVIGAALVMQGNSAGRTLLQRARTTAETIPANEDGGRSAAFIHLVAALVRAQYWKEARATAEAMVYPRRRAEALCYLVEALAKAQRWEEARATAESIPFADWRAEALNYLASALAQAQHPAATATFAEAHATAEAILDPTGRAGAFRNLASALAQAQHPAAAATFAEARTTAEAIPDDRGRTWSLRTLAEALIHTQYWAEARTTAEAIVEDPFGRRAETLSNLVGMLAQAQHWEEARATADAIPHARWRAKALSRLAGALAQTQHPAAAATLTEAQTISETIPDDFYADRAAVRCRLAIALSQAQRWEEARATADAIVDNTYGNRAEAFHYLLQALAQAQRWAEARAIIDTIPDDEDQSRAFELSNLAGALAQAQRWEEARATADAIPDDIWWRARALSDLAQALAQARLTTQLTALLTDFCRHAQTCNDLFRLFTTDATLFRAYPELGHAFFDSFPWVEAQLAVG